MKYLELFKNHIVKLDQSILFKIGSTEFSISNRGSDWLIKHKVHLDHQDWAEFQQIEEPIADGKEFRINKSPSSEQFLLKPWLQDKSIVAEPETPLNIQANSNCNIYISSPIDIDIVDQESNNSLLMIPTTNLSKTWFGQDNITGEISYHLKTNAVLDFNKINYYAHRAITQIHIQNDNDNNIKIEKIKTPIHTLKLYLNEKEHLWTQPLQYNAKKNSKIRIDKKEIESSWKLCSEPRTEEEQDRLIQNFKQLVL